MSVTRQISYLWVRRNSRCQTFTLVCTGFTANACQLVGSMEGVTLFVHLFFVLQHGPRKSPPQSLEENRLVMSLLLALFIDFTVL